MVGGSVWVVLKNAGNLDYIDLVNYEFKHQGCG